LACACPPLPDPLPQGATAFTHLSLPDASRSDSLPAWVGGGCDGAAVSGTVWRPPAGKRGAFLHARLVTSCGARLRIRRLGGTRAGEIRLTRFLRNASVTPAAMVAEAALRTSERCAGRDILAIQDTTVVRTGERGDGLYLHPVLVTDRTSGAILGLADARFLARDHGVAASRRRPRCVRRRGASRWWRIAKPTSTRRSRAVRHGWSC